MKMRVIKHHEQSELFIMKKSIVNIGKRWNKQQQNQVYGGGKTSCNTDTDCCFIGNPAYEYICNGIVSMIGTPSPATCGLEG